MERGNTWKLIKKTLDEPVFANTKIRRSGLDSLDFEMILIMIMIVKVTLTIQIEKSKLQIKDEPKRDTALIKSSNS